jgi:hypothetical protein
LLAFPFAIRAKSIDQVKVIDHFAAVLTFREAFRAVIPRIAVSADFADFDFSRAAAIRTLIRE